MPSGSLLKSGSVELDDEMDGGLKVNEILQIYGPAGVGKTTLALQFVVNTAFQGHNVIFIDAEKKFPILRLRQMSSVNFDRVSPKISVVSPSTLKEQGDFVSRLKEIVTTKTRLLVFDTIVSLYRTAMGESEDNIQLNRILNRHLGILASFVKTHPISAILINQVRGDLESPNGFVPVANSIISYWSSKNIRIIKAESMGYRELMLEKGPTKPKILIMKIGASGFKV